MIKKVLGSIIISSIISFNFVSAYNEIDCSTDAIFESNSCNQCFDGGEKNQGDYIGLLIDEWINATDKSQILYKEEQKMPEMLNLNSNNVIWGQTPSPEGFWEYGEDFENLYSEEDLGYLLEAGKKVTWLESKMGYAYELEKNVASKGSNIGLLVYPISIHTIGDDGMPSIDNDEHIECVLFKSAEASEDVVVVPEQKPERLPDTGPTEYMLLFLIAILLGFGVLKLSSRKS